VFIAGTVGALAGAIAGWVGGAGRGLGWRGGGGIGTIMGNRAAEGKPSFLHRG